MESDNCPAKEFCSSSSDAHSNLNCNGDSVVEGGHLAFNAASRVPNPEFEDLDSFNLIEPPPLDWRSDSSSEAGSVHEMDDPTFSPSSVTVDTPEGGSALPLDVSDAAVLPGVNQVELVKKLPEDSMEQSYGAREQVEEQDGDEKVEEAENFGDEEFEKVEERRPGDEDHTRIQVLLNRLQLIGESSLHDDSTLQNPSLVYAASSDLNLSDPSLTTGGGTLPVAPLQNQASGLLFSESHQRDLVGLLECTEIGDPQHLEAQAARGPRGDIDAVVSVSYSQEDGERFWDHYGNGQHRLRNDSMVSLPEDEDEVPEPVWMKLGEEPPEEAGAAEGSEQVGWKGLMKRHTALMLAGIDYK